MGSYSEIIGNEINLADLSIPKAIELANVLNSDKIGFVRFISCHRTEPECSETVVFEMEVERGQRTINDIRYVELIGIEFYKDDNVMPDVLALRPDFPLVPHLNVNTNVCKRSLCLFNVPYDEIKLYLTPTFLVKRISEWLALTAEDRLHGDDQPLEPLLPYTNDYIVIPSAMAMDLVKNPGIVTFSSVIRTGGHLTLIPEMTNKKATYQNTSTFTAITLACKPQPHGIIHRLPNNIFELHDLLRNVDIDILDSLRLYFRHWHINGKIKEVLETRLIIILCLPKVRKPGQKEEQYEIRGFYTNETIKNIGYSIGAWDIHEGLPGFIMKPDVTKDGKDISIRSVNICNTLTKDFAATLNDYKGDLHRKVALIGAGSLGSQLYNNLSRSGYGEWVIIDDDLLLPHNLARHVLTGEGVGFHKAYSLSKLLNNTIEAIIPSIPIVANVLHPEVEKERLNKIYNESDIILDVSTSVAVARHLSLDIESSARRISVFLNPSGKDSVIIAEDVQRNLTLDCLEMQYYRELINNSSLSGHLLSDESSNIRYANSCRDVSNRIANEDVVLHGAMCTKALKDILSKDNGSIIIIRHNEMNVNCVMIEPKITKKVCFGKWTVCYDDELIHKIYSYRSSKLPNETGGILLGSFDMFRNIVYIVDTLPSPPDSIEWPTVYIRGCEGLKEKVESIGKITAGRLEYVGEWHSHPNRCSSRPSSDDKKAFNSLAENMNIDGYPAIMIIAGEKEIGLYIESMDERQG